MEPNPNLSRPGRLSAPPLRYPASNYHFNHAGEVHLSRRTVYNDVRV